jgi:putative two-component system response regulator
MFIHWGIYSIPARGEWTYANDTWKEGEYEAFAKVFNPTNYNPREWAKLAKRAGMSEKAQNEIYIMALVHDVGKIGVPDAVINKRGSLTEEEFGEIKMHTVTGERILEKIEYMPELAVGAHLHHERIDGSGYPEGLTGEHIPAAARIIAVADAYDAMSSNRSYREAMPQSRVREEIEHGLGTQFDPKYGKIMLEMIDEDTEYRLREGGGRPA